MSPRTAAKKVQADEPDKPALSNIAMRRAKRRASDDGMSEQWLSIKQAAGLVFYERGYANTTLDDVARAVGLDRSSIYYYVGDKAELLLEAVVPLVSRSPERITEAAAVSDPEDRIRSLIGVTMAIFTDGWPHIMVYLDQALQDDHPAVAEQIRHNGQLINRHLREAIEEGIRLGQFIDTVDTRAIARGVVAMCFGVRDWWRPGTVSLAAVGEEYAAFVLRGLRPG